MSLWPVLEIGGTHVTAAIVDLLNDVVVRQNRVPIDAAGDADALLGSLARAALSLPRTGGRRWGIAMPGPFDYDNGIGLFEGVAKLDALSGVDVNRELGRRLRDVADEFVFVNDADAFGLGECSHLPAHASRGVFLTLGTGVGSSFISGGQPIHDAPGLPPQGHAYLLEWAGRPIEDSVSRRAIMQAYEMCSGQTLDVHEIASRARDDDACAQQTLTQAFDTLGRCLAPVIAAFNADAVVIGGSIAKSWDLVEPPFVQGLRAGHPFPSGELAVQRATSGDDAPLLGAARAAQSLPAAPRP